MSIKHNKIDREKIDYCKKELNISYYDSRMWSTNYWMGVTIEKSPYDMFLYQEIIHKTKPDIIIECGTWEGGSATYMAHLCDIMGAGKIITIDPKPQKTPHHDRIIYIKKDSLQALEDVKNIINPEDRVMVILDSLHTKEHVLAEMRLYSHLVTQGCYLIVEDTNMNGNPILPNSGPGPGEAVEHYMTDNPNDFIITDLELKALYSFNPRGYLKKL